MTTTFSLSEKARATSRKTRTKTSRNVLLHVNTNNEVIKFLQRGQNKDYNTDIHYLNTTVKRNARKR